MPVVDIEPAGIGVIGGSGLYDMMCTVEDHSFRALQKNIFLRRSSFCYKLRKD